MLVIRDVQLAALAEPRLGALRAWLHPHLRKHFGERLLETDDAALKDFIDASVARAMEHGVRSSQGIVRFAHLRVLFGEGFEALPWAAETLSRTDIPTPESKIEILYGNARRALTAKGGA
ncbi:MULTISPECIES: hypothetical protein [Myxococcus]|uniref:hypothetical protein n=1 Tax=Myxococcus TaxID=32 RepID=UPI001144A0DA|nr:MULTISPECIES: hypothetical protein [Myxococcus]NOK04655.1 hypothetical protein [Myxococcus xanthus]